MTSRGAEGGEEEEEETRAAPGLRRPRPAEAPLPSRPVLLPPPLPPARAGRRGSSEAAMRSA